VRAGASARATCADHAPANKRMPTKRARPVCLCIGTFVSVRAA